jgi:phytoene synthase
MASPHPGRILSPADLAACRAMLAGGSKSFHAASRLLPAAICEPATALYAFCRVADDVIDEDSSPEALAELEHRLDLVYAGNPIDHCADRALAAVVRGYAIPRTLPAALLDGFAWDRAGRRYETLAEVQDYAARVAGTVGAMMALLMGVRAPEVLARACDLGTAMQLSNICRDVGEDARAGRLYLPMAWLREAGTDPDEFLANPRFDARIGAVVQRLLNEAEVLYHRAESGIARLPLACRPGIGAARWIYAEIGREVERQGCDSVNRRAIVSSRRKLALLAKSVACIAIPAASAHAPPLPANRYLVEAVRASRAPRPETLSEQVGWFLDLMMRRERERQGGTASV